MQRIAIKQTLILGIFFLIMTTSYTSFSNVISFISQHSDLQYSFEGQIVLIVNYFVYLIGLISATSIVNYKKHFLIAAICYTINYALYFFQFNKDMSLVIGVIGAIIGGYGAAILWVSEGGYMTKLLSKNNIQKNDSGKFIGILNGLIYCQSFLGAVIITFGLGIFGNNIYFTILTATGILAFGFCFIFLSPLVQSKSLEHQQLQEEKNEYNNYNMQINEESNQINQNLKISSCTQLKNILNFYPKMKLLIFPILLDGVMLGFISTAFTNLLPQAMNDSVHLGYLLMVAGIGAVVGAFFAGYLTDRIKTSQVGILIILLTLSTMLMTLLVFYVKFQTMTYSLILGFLWGTSFNAMQSWLFACCTKVYEGKIQSYAIVKQIHTFSYILFQIHMIITNRNFHYNACFSILILLCILSLVSCRLLQNFQTQKISKLQQKSPDASVHQK